MLIISTPQRVQNSGNILIGSPYTPNSAMVTQSHITEASGWVPGVRKRTHEFIESDFSDSKRMKKVGEKNGKGLRHFSMKVCEKVQKKGTTTYSEVADELVAEFTNSSSLLAADSQVYDQKNIRRRVYDALNVLMAMNIISKEKKEIKWIGLPTNSAQECQNLELEKQKRMERIKQKRSQLQELILQVNKKERKATFVICEYLFNFDNTFEIHDDIEVLKRMGMSFGLESGKCSSENLKIAKSLVPKSLESYVTGMTAGPSWLNQDQFTGNSEPTLTALVTGSTASTAHISSNPELCADTEVALTTRQFLTHSSRHSSSTTTSHYSESRGETPCSFNDDDEDEDEDSSSPE
ncbi:UNVERIFIED_CONTAM: hypothetical protein FKN15_036026 [Acipenser sinensis]